MGSKRKKVTDVDIKEAFELEGTFVKIVGNRVLRFSLGKLAPEYLFSRDEAVRRILSIRGMV